MSTAPVVKQPNGFVRFIDSIGHFFVKVAPVANNIAVAAEPFLALTPFGPEYDLAVNAIIGIQKTATASIAAGGTLTSEQKLALVVQAITPGLNTILASKGVTEDTQTHIATWAQLVFNLLAGPAIVTPAKAA